MWTIEGYDQTDNLVAQYELPTLDEATLLLILGIRDRSEYLGGMVELSIDARNLLKNKYGVEFSNGISYFLEYLRDFPGQKIAYDH